MCKNQLEHAIKTAEAEEAKRASFKQSFIKDAAEGLMNQIHAQTVTKLETLERTKKMERQQRRRFELDAQQFENEEGEKKTLYKQKLIALNEEDR